MTFGERRKATQFFEESRGTSFRNLSYAGIAAAWALGQETVNLSSLLVIAIVLFAACLAVDAYYIHRMAIEERAQYLELEAAYQKAHKGAIPGDDESAPYNRDKVKCDENFSKFKMGLLAFACVCLICGATGILAKLWGLIPSCCR